MNPVQLVLSTNTHALKITHDHIHFPEFEFVKILINYTSVVCRKEGNNSFECFATPTRRHHKETCLKFFSELILKKDVSFISHWSADPDCCNTYLSL